VAETVVWRSILFLLALLLAAPAAAARDYPPAPEFPQDLPWLNVSRPLTLEDLRGKVVILDFWTYGCINCLHVAEELKALEARFGNHLAVISVHSPKFDNEKDLGTLRRNILRYGLRHPVIQDEDYRLMTAYAAPAWPTLAVIDPAGRYVARTTGEGKGERLAQYIERVLEVYADFLNDEPLPLALEQPDEGTPLSAPGGVAVSERWVAVSDSLHNRVVVSDPQGRVQAIFGDGTAGISDGAADTARFKFPQGLTISGDRIYVADAGNHAVRVIDMKARQVSTLAGTGEVDLRSPRLASEGQGTAIALRSPWAVALAGEELYVAMAGAHQIWRLDLKSGRIGPWAGSGREGLDDGPLARATFSQPSGLAILGHRLYVADAEASAVREIDLDKGEVNTLIGTGLFDFGDRDGPLDEASLQHPGAIMAEGLASLLIADTYNHRLKRLDLGDRKVTSVLGSGKPGAELGEAPTSFLNEPSGIAALGEKVLVVDTNNDRLVLFDPSTDTASEWPLVWPRIKDQDSKPE